MSKETRVIKYRGKVEGRWWHVTPEDDNWELFWSLVNKEKVGEFTGSYDRNNQEIYEDDIVVVEGTDTFIIVYDHASFLIKNKEWRFHLDEHAPSMLKVVGNIHDDPEMYGFSEQEA